MTTITTVGSGSSGNCYIVESVYNGVSMGRLIIEAGVRFKTVQEALKFDLKDVCGCLLSHEHGDHAGFAAEYARYQITLCGTMGTISALGLPVGTRAVMLPKKQSCHVGVYRVMAFETEHDAAEPCGFLINCPDGNRILFATDTYYLKYKFPMVSIYMLECNYEESVLRRNIKEGNIHPSVGERVRNSHMSLSQCVETLKANDLSKAKAIILIHLSGDNGKPEHFQRKVEEVTGRLVYVARKGGIYSVF